MASVANTTTPRTIPLDLMRRPSRFIELLLWKGSATDGQTGHLIQERANFFCVCGPSQDLTPIVRAAGQGDDAAWEALVERFSGLIWAVARGHGLSSADAADVSQTCWLRLAEHLGRIRDPERIGGWLATTARNESVNLLRHARRCVALGEDGEIAMPTECTDVAARLLAGERDVALWRAFESLPPRCKTLLRVLTMDPAPTYVEVSAVLGMPVGSIGPTRGRCLQSLRERAAIRVEEERRAGARR
jgi:RNA polymerase sigma factor (sigma-70 family)